jgi:hypothetical protein
VTVVAGVLLDHVQVDPPQCVRLVVIGAGRDLVQVAPTDGRARSRDARMERRQISSAWLGSTALKQASGSPSVPYPSISGPSSKSWNHASTSVRCRTSPRSDKVEGGEDRSASCSGVRPAHLVSRVARGTRATTLRRRARQLPADIAERTFPRKSLRSGVRSRAISRSSSGSARRSSPLPNAMIGLPVKR